MGLRVEKGYRLVGKGLDGVELPRGTTQEDPGRSTQKGVPLSRDTVQVLLKCRFTCK